MRENTICKIEENKIIVIVRGVAKDKLIPLAEAMYKGGIRLIECTYDASGKVTDEETASNIEMLSKHLEGRMLVGAGTVLTEKQVELTAKAGGRFIISPDTCESIIKKTVELGLVSIPGALTPTEVETAHRYGADFVKVFPVNFMGPSYIKALKAPLSHIRLLAVGGIDENNMKDYMNAGACGFGVATGIVNKTAVADGDFDAITRLALKYTEQL